MKYCVTLFFLISNHHVIYQLLQFYLLIGMVEKWDSVLGHPGTSDTPGTPGTFGTPGTPSTSGSHGPSDPLRPQDLKTLDKLPLPFEIQNLNTIQLFLICCKKYHDEISHRYGSVVFLAKV